MVQNRKWVVLKFGGTSVSTRENWEKILQIIQDRQKEGYSICVVHSALKGISDLLHQCLVNKGKNPAFGPVERIQELHLQHASRLGLNGSILLEPYFTQLEGITNRIRNEAHPDARTEAELMALGELMSTTLGSAFLKKMASKYAGKTPGII